MAESSLLHRVPGGLRREWWGRWYWRWPIKAAIFLAVTLVVLFPRPGLFARHLAHVRDMQAMIAPDDPRLEELEGEVRARLDEEATSARFAATDRERGLLIQQQIERLVLERVEYAWDWDTWGCADYMPTVAEMFDVAAATQSGLREDCDGRAIVAASLMRRMGYDARLATDLRHVWVVTPEGEWMGPGGAKSATSTDEGNDIHWTGVIRNIPMSLSYGIAVFPLPREIIILLTAYGLMLTRRTPGSAAVLALLLLMQGLLFMRLGFLAPLAVARQASSWPAWVGIFHILAGFAVLIRGGSRHARA
jgi:hypothetical protein